MKLGGEMTTEKYEELKRAAAEKRLSAELEALRKQVIDQACQIAQMAKEIEGHEITIRMQKVRINHLEDKLQ